MAEHDIPKGVSLDTLHEILVGWSDAGAAEEPRYTADVAALTSVSDVVGRQTRFLEALGVLAPHNQRHELTDAGRELADALADGDADHARTAARDLLFDWGLTEDVRGVLEDNPTGRDELVDRITAAATEATAAAQDARAAAEEARTAAETAAGGGAAGDTAATEPHAVSLDLDIDSADLEAIVRGVRAGLMGDE